MRLGTGGSYVKLLARLGSMLGCWLLVFYFLRGRFAAAADSDPVHAVGSAFFFGTGSTPFAVVGSSFYALCCALLWFMWLGDEASRRLARQREEQMRKQALGAGSGLDEEAGEGGSSGEEGGRRSGAGRNGRASSNDTAVLDASIEARRRRRHAMRWRRLWGLVLLFCGTFFLHDLVLIPIFDADTKSRIVGGGGSGGGSGGGGGGGRGNGRLTENGEGGPGPAEDAAYTTSFAALAASTHTAALVLGMVVAGMNHEALLNSVGAIAHLGPGPAIRRLYFAVLFPFISLVATVWALGKVQQGGIFWWRAQGQDGDHSGSNNNINSVLMMLICIAAATLVVSEAVRRWQGWSMEALWLNESLNQVVGLGTFPRGGGSGGGKGGGKRRGRSKGRGGRRKFSSSSSSSSSSSVSRRKSSNKGGTSSGAAGTSKLPKRKNKKRSSSSSSSNSSSRGSGAASTLAGMEGKAGDQAELERKEAQGVEEPAEVGLINGQTAGPPATGSPPATGVNGHHHPEHAEETKGPHAVGDGKGDEDEDDEEEEEVGGKWSDEDEGNAEDLNPPEDVVFCRRLPAECLGWRLIKWSRVAGDTFRVRAKGYAAKKKKELSGRSMYECVRVVNMRFKKKGQDMASLLRIPAGGDRGVDAGALAAAGIPLWFVVNWQVPTYAASMFSSSQDGEGNSMVQLFKLAQWVRDLFPAGGRGGGAPPVMSPALDLWARLNLAPQGDPVEDQFKLIARLEEWETQAEKLAMGSLKNKLVNTYNAKPFLARPQQVWWRHPDKHCVGVDLDVHRFGYMVRSQVAGMLPRVPDMTVSTAYVVEGRGDAELPEQVLAAVTVREIEFDLD